MAAIENEIDRALAADDDQADPADAITRDILIACSAPGGFKRAPNGTLSPAAIIFDAIPIGMPGAVVTWITDGANITFVGNHAQLAAQDMDVDKSVITANLTYQGETHQRSITIQTLQDGTLGSTTYTWIRYADSAAGAGISNDPTGKEYVGFASGKSTAVESNDPNDYQWLLVKGSDGSSLRMWIKYSDNPNGAGMYDTPGTTTLYIGIAVNKSDPAESNDPADYVWSRFKGADGVAVASYVWIRYADTAAGGGMSNDPTGKAYIGLAYNKPAATESNDPAQYAWSLIKGTDGVGVKGDDGVTLYTWLKYSASADGAGMYDIPNDSTVYIGIAINKTTATEGTNPAEYTWSKIRGADGVSVPGSRGAGFYRTTGNAWNDATADAVTPGGNVVGDIVTISNGVVSYTKEWSGNSWFFPGAFLPGNLLVERSIFAALIAVDAVRAEHILSDSIEARHLKADIIEARHLKADIITARHLSVMGSSDNLIRDPQFRDLVYWGRVGCAVGDWTTAGFNTGWKGGASLYLGQGDGSLRDSLTPYFNIEPGATYRLEYQVSVPAGFNGQATVSILIPAFAWWPMSGVVNRRGTWGDGTTVEFIAADAGQRHDFSSLLTIPNDSRCSRALIRIRDQYSSAQLEIGAMSITRVVDSTLIGPASVQTKHLSIAQGGDISSGQTGFDQGNGFWLEGAGNGHSARMSIGNSAGSKILMDPGSTTPLRIINAEIQGAIVAPFAATISGSLYGAVGNGRQGYNSLTVSASGNFQGPLSYLWAVTYETANGTTADVGISGSATGATASFAGSATNERVYLWTSVQIIDAAGRVATAERFQQITHGSFSAQ